MSPGKCSQVPLPLRRMFLLAQSLCLGDTHLCYSFTDTHSLSYNFSITAQPKPQQPWREIQGQMDQMVFLSFCCGGEVNPVGTLGRKLNSTKTWEPQIEMLKDVTEELRNKLLDPKPEIFPTSGKCEKAP